MNSQVDSLNFAVNLARRAAETRCHNVVVLDMRGRSPVTEFFVLATGTSDRQMRTVADELSDHGKQTGFKPFRRSGEDSASWILIDFVNVVAHIFNETSRAFYELENLWDDCPRVDWQITVGVAEESGPKLQEMVLPAEADKITVAVEVQPDGGEPEETQAAEVQVVDLPVQSIAVAKRLPKAGGGTRPKTVQAKGKVRRSPQAKTSIKAPAKARPARKVIRVVAKKRATTAAVKKHAAAKARPPAKKSSAASRKKAPAKIPAKAPAKVPAKVRAKARATVAKKKSPSVRRTAR